MKKQNSSLESDVKELVDETSVTEAAAKVWDRFENALSQLDADSITLLRAHFEGKSNESLAQARNISPAEVKGWLDRIKRELIQQLRNESPVRQ